MPLSKVRQTPLPLYFKKILIFTSMETNEIKKLLYKQNPKANFNYIRKGYAYYDAPITDSDKVFKFIKFEIPITDMGDADFHNQMDAKFLVRWILNVNEEHPVT